MILPFRHRRVRPALPDRRAPADPGLGDALQRGGGAGGRRPLHRARCSCSPCSRCRRARRGCTCSAWPGWWSSRVFGAPAGLPGRRLPEPGAGGPLHPPGARPALAARSPSAPPAMMDAFIHGLRLVPSRSQGGALLPAHRRLLVPERLGHERAGPGLRPPPHAHPGLHRPRRAGGRRDDPGRPGDGRDLPGRHRARALALRARRRSLDTRGTAYANVLWAVQLAFTTALGLFFLFSRHIRIAQIFSAPAEVEEGLEEEEKRVRRGGGRGAPGRRAPAR